MRITCIGFCLYTIQSISMFRLLPSITKYENMKKISIGVTSSLDSGVAMKVMITVDSTKTLDHRSSALLYQTCLGVSGDDTSIYDKETI